MRREFSIWSAVAARFSTVVRCACRRRPPLIESVPYRISYNAYVRGGHRRAVWRIRRRCVLGKCRPDQRAAIDLCYVAAGRPDFDLGARSPTPGECRRRTLVTVLEARSAVSGQLPEAVRGKAVATNGRAFTCDARGHVHHVSPDCAAHA